MNMHAPNSGQVDHRPPRAGRGDPEAVRVTAPITTPPRAATAQAVREMGPEATRAWGDWFNDAWDRKFQATVNDPDGDVLGIAVRAAVMVRNELVDEINEKLVGENAQKLVDIKQELEARIAAAEMRIAAAEASAAAEGRRRDDEAMKTSKDIASLRVALSDKVAALRERIANTVEKRPPAVGPAQVNRIVEAAVARACSDLRSEFVAERGDLVSQIATLEKRLNETTGELPQIRTWEPGTVHYRGSLVTQDGELWQAKRDCATRPDDGDDWAKVARAGRDGQDGASITMRGLYHPRRAYNRLDVVLWAGEPLLAKHDSPGAPPGEGWLKLAQRGKRGEKGARGAAGPRGPRGAKGDEGDVTVERWKVDPAYYRVTPILSNGRVGRPLELRSLFEQFMQEPAD
jgi:hypothetical protein